MKKTSVTFMAFLLLAASFAAGCIVPAPGYAIVVGQAGATYPIAEKDALKEIKQRVKEVDWAKEREALKRSVLDYRPTDLPSLPRARRDRAFMVDPLYTLKRYIPDGKGGILYPKGYTFNPLDYLSLPDVLVFIDGDDKAQVEWFQKSAWSKYGNVQVMLTGGSYRETEKELERPVFYAPAQMIKRFRIAAVPSVLYQRGKLLEVKEFDIRKKK